MGKVGKFIVGMGLVIGGLALGFTGNWGLGIVVAGAGLRMFLTPHPPGTTERQGWVLQTRTGANNGVPVLYGTAKVGGLLVDTRVDGASTADRRLAVVTAWAHGSQDGGGIGGSVNVVANPGGEIGTLGAQATSWTKESGNDLVQADDFVKIGSRSLKTVNGSAVDSRNYQDFSVTVGRMYRASAWIKTTALPTGDTGWGALLHINFVSGVSGFTILDRLTYGGTPPLSTRPTCGIAADGNAWDWTYVETTFIPTGTNGTIRLYAQLGFTGNQSGTAWFDEVHLEAIPLEVYFDERLAINADGVVQTPFSPAVPGESGVEYLEYQHHLGPATQEVDARLTSLFPTEWPSTSRGRGVAYTRFELWFNPDIYPSGVPQIQASIYGQRVYDPRDKTLKWSNNPALCIRDYLTSTVYGMGVPAANIDEQSFIDMANYCDEVVTIPGEGSAARYVMNGWVDVRRSTEENLMQLCTACRGMVVNQGALWRLIIRRQRVLSGFHLNEFNTVEGSWTFTLPGADAPNVVRAVFVDPAQQWQTDTAQWPQPGTANAYLTADNGHESRLELELPYTTSRARAEQIAMTVLKEQRSGITVTAQLHEAALSTQIGDLIEISQSSPGWTKKVFDVVALLLEQDGGIRGVFVEYNPTTYDLDAQNAPPTIPDTGLPDPFVVAAPTGLTLVGDAAAAIITDDGTYVPRIKTTWSGADPFIRYYEVEAKPTAATNWDSYGTVPGDGVLEFFVGPVTEANWSVRVRAVNNLNVRSAWTTQTVTVDSGVVILHWGSLNAGGHLVVTFVGQFTQSVKIATSTSSQPAAGTGTTVNAGSGSFDAGTGFAYGDTIYITITPYTGSGATGFQGPARFELTTFPYFEEFFATADGLPSEQTPFTGGVKFPVSVLDLMESGRVDHVLNGDFEHGARFWGEAGPGTASIEVGGDVYRGAGSLKIAGTSGGATTVVPTDSQLEDFNAAPASTRVHPYARLVVRAAGKVQNVASNAMTVSVAWLDEDENGLTSETMFQWSQAAGETTYSEKSAVAVGPAGAYYARIVITHTGAANGNVWLDELHAWIIPSALAHGEYDIGNKSANFDLDAFNGPMQRVRLTASITIGSDPGDEFTHFMIGSVMRLRIVQDGTGSRVPTFPDVAWGAAGTPTWRTAPGGEDIIELWRPGAGTGGVFGRLIWQS